MGKSLNQAVRDYLKQLAGSTHSLQEWDEFEQRCLQTKGRLDGWQFNRKEANAQR